MAGRNGILLYNDIHNPEKSLHLAYLSYFNESWRANTEQEPRWFEAVGRPDQPHPPVHHLLSLYPYRIFFKKRFSHPWYLSRSALPWGHADLSPHNTQTLLIPAVCRGRAGCKPSFFPCSQNDERSISLQKRLFHQRAPLWVTPCQGLCIWN